MDSHAKDFMIKGKRYSAFDLTGMEFGDPGDTLPFAMRSGVPPVWRAERLAMARPTTEVQVSVGTDGPKV